MLRKMILASLLASGAMTLAIATPATAGKSDRAREAIAAAEAKLQTAESLGAANDAPRDTADARAALAMAKEDFKSGDKEPAIRQAIRASALADTAIGIAQRHKNDAVASARDAQRATLDAARDQVAGAQNQATVAQDQAAAAQEQAAKADARADSAQQSAAASAADAAAARNAATLAAQTPPAAAPAPQVETTITTRQGTGARHTTRTKVAPHTTTTTTRAGATPSTEVTATTKVTPQ